MRTQLNMYFILISNKDLKIVVWNDVLREEMRNKNGGRAYGSRKNKWYSEGQRTFPCHDRMFYDGDCYKRCDTQLKVTEA